MDERLKLMKKEHIFYTALQEIEKAVPSCVDLSKRERQTREDVLDIILSAMEAAKKVGKEDQ